MEYAFELTSDRAETDSTFIWDQLYQFNMQFTEPDQHTILNIFVRNERGELIGGLLGETSWRGLHTNILWIHKDYRRVGLGKQLMAKAEAESIRRGCRHTYVDTLNFQAPDFYLKLGYIVWGVLEDFPPGHRRIFLQKDISTSTNI